MKKREGGEKNQKKSLPPIHSAIFPLLLSFFTSPTSYASTTIYRDLGPLRPSLHHLSISTPSPATSSSCAGKRVDARNGHGNFF